MFDRKGALVAIIAPSAEAPKLVAGVAPLAPHRAIGAEDIQRFLVADRRRLRQRRRGDAPRGAGRDRRGRARLCRCDFLPPMNKARPTRGPRVLVFDSGLGGLTVFAQIAQGAA